MARVIWGREALAQIDLIQAYLDQFDPVAARQISAKLLEAGESLRQFPQRGRPVGSGRRELPIVRPYILRYQVIDDNVLIFTVRHGRQDRQS